MKMAKMLIPTLREVPAEAEIKSHQLMLRAGLMRKTASGVYHYLPLGLKALKKVEEIVRDEMDKHGAQELLMPAVLPAEVYMESGRWQVFGPEMFRLKDRNDRDFCLGPTHEEIFTATVKNDIHSYKNLPVTLYQIQSKYRDERRPRFGVMRSREFIMKDAYSFDMTQEGLDLSYKNMYDAYCKIFDRMQLDYTPVDADSGAMGGSGSQEFMVKSEVGEGVIAFCTKCDYAANDEKAVCIPTSTKNKNDGPLNKIHTPNIKTIDDLVGFFNVDATAFAKTIIYNADGKLVAAMVRGDREINETKLQNLLGAIEIELASAEEVFTLTNAQVGFAGPIGLEIDVYIDREVELMKNFIIGANQTDYHYENVNLSDFKVMGVTDLRTIVKGDTCPVCGGKIDTALGIEVGHIFKLGTKYSKALGCNLLNEIGEEIPAIMGCYGIGINRCLAAIIEQHSDENGIIWPMSVAPYKVIIVLMNKDDKVQLNLATNLYDTLRENGVDVLLDDRDERPGVKFKDADLIGIPLRITVGRKAGEDIVEYKLRESGEMVEKHVNDAFADALKLCK